MSIALICANGGRLPYVKITLKVYEKTLGQTSYSKSFISTDTSLSKINKKLAINIVKKLFILFRHYNKGVKDV